MLRDQRVKHMFDTHKRLMGILMLFEGGIILIMDKNGKFIGKFDGENTYELVDGKHEYYCWGNACWELAWKHYSGRMGGEGSVCISSGSLNSSEMKDTTPTP